jgi:hypothetical protein
MVNNGLTTYIKVHDTIHRETETFWSSVKNLFGFGVSMIDMLRVAKKLVPLWDLIYKKLEEFRSLLYESLSKDEKLYFDTLLKFTVALQKTIGCLVDRQRLLADGSEKIGSMTWKEHQEKRAIYLASVEEYLVIGQELNIQAESVTK